MPYATLSDLQARLGSQVSSSNPGIYQQLTDRLAATTENSTVGQELLDAAQGYVDSKLGVRYAVPINTSLAGAVAASMLRSLVLDIAEWRAWKEHAFNEDIPGRVTDAYNHAVASLGDIVDAEAIIPSLVELEGPTQRGFTTSVGGHARVFNVDQSGRAFL